MELVWVRVFPTDLQLVDCLTTDLVVLLLKKEGQYSEVEHGRLCCLLLSTVSVTFPVTEYLTEQLKGGRRCYSSLRRYG